MKKSIKLLTLHGPNLNLLGIREPEVYGATRLVDINQKLIELSHQWGYEILCKQSQAEHDLITWIHQALEDSVSLILFNPGAFTHTSIALRDALLAVQIPFIEVHLSVPSRRESFRRISYFSDIALGSISGFGSQSYELALRAARYYLTTQGE